MTFDSNAVFQREFDKAIAADVAKSGFPVEQWFRNGRTLPANAVAEWRTRGPQLVDRFITWYEQSDYEVWVSPDGVPAIELELNPRFGDIDVHMYIDLVLVNRLGLCVVDLKSGSTMPYDLSQLGFYASGIELEYKIRPLYGSHYMARGRGPKGASDDEKTYFQEPRPLTAYRYSVPYYTNQLAMMDRGVSQGVFVADVGQHCDRCSVAHACIAVGGDNAAKYDPSHPAHERNHQ